MPAFQRYRGKPAVRNDREGRGNVGIIRSPVRASTLPDCGGRVMKHASLPLLGWMAPCGSIWVPKCRLVEDVPLLDGAARCRRCYLRGPSTHRRPQLFIRRGGLIRACVAQDPKPPLLVGHVDIAARIHQLVLCLGYEVARKRTSAFARWRWDEP